MCGIAGIVQTTGPVDQEALRRMTSTLRHRGPDDEDYHLSERGGTAVGMGFRRLAIIDLQGGRQPMCNEDGSLWIVCNGELYNYQELRRELEAKGHQFRTHCDVETLLHLYEEKGTDCVSAVNGMFAAAIWDSGNQTLFLARDRLGKKPLYYRATATQLLFGSEVKALLQHPDCPRELDPRSLSKYLAYEYVPSPHCIFKGVNKLPPGHSLTWRQGDIRVQRYWDVKFPEPLHRSEAEIAEELRARLKEAVRLRLISDVPLGVFLSGGIDSSSVVAMMAELRPAAQIKTFAIGFEEASFDESRYARRVAEFFGTEHHEEVLQSRVLLDLLPDVAGLLDEPFADASVIPTYLLSRFTRRHVTVALGGDGGDELFAGYPTFAAHRLARFYRLPGAVHKRLVLPLANLLPVSTENFSLDFKVKRFLRGARESAGIRDQMWLGSFTPAEQAELLAGTAPAVDDYEDVARVEKDCASRDPLQRLIYQYCKLYLPEDILVKVDRASMACSLEARAPFLDYTFVEFANSIPSRLKLKGFKGKYILKQAMQGKLPTEILARGKKGFGIPIAKWFRNGLRELVADTLSPSRIKQQGIFNPRTVERLLSEHLQGTRDNRKQLWTLLLFELWVANYLEKAPR
ncbi:MAG TPA: asparagine synthase (glutamine-hydrolyzing) [Candidatus Acidoferrum sp.]|nr:asparagine synthase (glutamine-hydrolyzing) [Candidatus Acidoferrum sp.]